MVSSLLRVSANAVTPDQLLPYVKAVSGLESAATGDCVLHYGGGQGVLVAYGIKNPEDLSAMNEAVAKAVHFPGLEKLTVLGPAVPDLAPVDAQGQTDCYWQLVLPLESMSGKLRNLLKRAQRDVTVKMASGEGSWQKEHEHLTADFCKRKADSLDNGTCFLFARLGDYLAHATEAVLFSAYDTNEQLIAFAIGDFTSLATAFYMFAARSAAAVPGTADLLLYSLLKEAESRGYSRVNLGLGINGGVEFFKKKWGATPLLPYVETSWTLTSQPKKKDLWSKLFGK